LLKKILDKQNVEVIECKEEIHGFLDFIKSYFRLFFRHRKLEYDLMIIPWRGIITFPLAKFLSKKPIVFFPFISSYQTFVIDRKLIKKNSIKARFLHFADSLACKWSDLIILNTNSKIDYFCNEFGIDKKKFRRILLSADESIFKPLSLKKPSETFEVLFIGTYIPLHGVEVIIEAAKILQEQKDIKFFLMGKGQTRLHIEELVTKYNLKNVVFMNNLKLEKLPEVINSSDVCLGIFSNNQKALSAIPHKIVISLCSQKPVITMDSPGIREIDLRNKENCILVKPNNPSELAQAIISLKNNPLLSQKIAINGYDIFKNLMSMESTGKELMGFLQSLLKNKI